MNRNDGKCPNCGAPIKDGIDRCPYCRILYPQKAKARGMFVDININGEVIHTYIGNVEKQTIADTGRTADGSFIQGDVREFRKITLIEV